MIFFWDELFYDGHANPNYYAWFGVSADRPDFSSQGIQYTLVIFHLPVKQQCL